jgi:phosphoribosylglycinamide formyltransferase 1
MEKPRPRLVILASGNGSNFQAVIDATRAADPGQRLDADIVGLYSHTASALALARAERYGIPRHFVKPPAKRDDRTAWDLALADRIHAECAPFDLVLLLGWMRILTPAFLGRFEAPILNLHPSLPGDLPGVDAIERAFEEFEAGTRKTTGVMVHRVVPEIDAGPIIASESIDITPHSDFDAFKQSVHRAEHRVVLAAIRKVLGGT